MKLIFFSSVANKDVFLTHGFYKEDITILKNLGYEIIISNNYKDFIFKNYDVAFLYFYKLSVVPALICKLRNKKIYYTGGIDELSNKFYVTPLKRLIFKLLFLINLLLSTRINVVSNSDEININNLLKSLNLIKLNKKISVFPHSAYMPVKYVRLEDKCNNFITIAWMETKSNVIRKGLDQSLFIFANYLKLHPTSKYYIVGQKGEGYIYLMSIINDLQITNNVIFTGLVEDEKKFKLLTETKFYFQLSKYEGFGIAALEASIFNNFVIHSGNGGILESGDLIGVKFDNLNSTFNFTDKDYVSIFKSMEINKDRLLKKYSRINRQLNFLKMINNE